MEHDLLACPRMALRVTFKYGFKQALEASAYFTSVAEELVRGCLAELEQRNYLVMPLSGEPLPLRQWSNTAFLGEERQKWIEVIATLHNDIEQLSSGAIDLGKVDAIVDRWLHTFDGCTHFFLEQLHPGQSFRSEDTPLLSLAVIGGHLVMLSSTRVMFTRFGSDLFGLAIAGVGSYLIEDLSAGAPAHQRLLRA